MVTVIDIDRRRRLWNLRRFCFVMFGLGVFAFCAPSDYEWLRSAVICINAAIWLVYSGVIGKELDRTKPLSESAKEVTMKKT